MNITATFKKYTLEFKRPGGTSRGVLHVKDSWFIILRSQENPDLVGIGECGLLKGLSYDDREGYEAKLVEVCANPKMVSLEDLREWPSILFGLEMALLDIQTGGKHLFFDNAFYRGHKPIPINGLIWMGDPDFMREQIEAKLEQGFNCIKIKIGAIDFDTELHLLQSIRNRFSASEIELRVDANGAFSVEDAPRKLEQLAKFDLHSIEQPIKQGQYEAMAALCRNTPLPIALDEELIGLTHPKEKQQCLDAIRPQYIILKPSLIGGFSGTDEWIAAAQKHHIPWWVTSALESNIGLNAIAQYCASKNVTMPQGLGTGQLYTNNFPSPLEVTQGALHYRPSESWDISALLA